MYTLYIGTDHLSLKAQENATQIFNYLLRCKLASKRVLKEYRLTKQAFDYIIGEIRKKFYQAVVSPLGSQYGSPTPGASGSSGPAFVGQNASRSYYQNLLL